MSLLPKVNKYGLYEIRFESIGGFGANLAGKMLSDIGQQFLGLNVASFSSYGSEKKGTPVKAFIRFAEPSTEIKVTEPIENPDILVVFVDSLLKNPDVLAGCTKDTLIIINTRKSHEEIMSIIDLPECKLSLINATDISMEEGIKTNGILLGALSKVSSFLKKEYVNEMFIEVIGKKYPALLESNLKGIERGYNENIMKDLKGSSNASYKPFIRSGISGLGYKNQVIGGVIPNAGNAANKSNAAGRYGFIPLFSVDKCINCGMCNIVCPDQCIVWEEGTDKKTGNFAMNMSGIDYQYCKGCLKCVEICPVKALTEVKESDYNTLELSKDVLDKTAMIQNH